VDGKAALAQGEHLRLACCVLHDKASELGVAYEAVGGLTMGADQFAHGLAVLFNRDWFVVRKEPKRRGTNKLIEGSSIGDGTRVLLVDDVVSTGGSIQVACERVMECGAAVVGAASLVDRGDIAKQYFDERGIPYFAVVTYRHLGIPPVGRTAVSA
jgi:orotate phosphoribosyltransferase